jgi:hypothetical protein
MAKIGDTEVKGGIQTTVTNIDPETGQITWDVEYSADYQKLFKDITDLMKTAKEVADVTGEDFFRDHYLDIRKRRNELRTYLRNNKAKEYARIKGLDEISTSGAAGAYLTKNAFNPNKKADGTASNYYYKLGWKPVNQKKLNKQAKGIEVKHLFEK